ncbi:hypothetical protein E2C01_039576 [Portunus trituberculatus]|uniref:Uncharacterized protein n=1 Tax=Portunus trituberculatus TaxID=210409 RepID=A0A5B7FDZ8_PORTR|nr:hypothetical protein [Portunus trituberculatus]
MKTPAPVFAGASQPQSPRHIPLLRVVSFSGHPPNAAPCSDSEVPPTPTLPPDLSAALALSFSFMTRLFPALTKTIFSLIT